MAFPESKRTRREGRGRWGSRREGLPAAAPTREPPNSAEAEKHVLACCLLDSADSIPRAEREGVTIDTFYQPANKELWRIIREQNAVKPPVTLDSLIEELKTQRLLEAVGGYPYLMQVTGEIPTTAHLGYMIEKIREKEMLRAVVKEGTRMVEGAYEYSGGGMDKHAPFVAGMEALQKVRANASRLPAPRTWSALAEDKALVRAPELVHGLMHAGRRLILAAPSKAHKTWSMMDLALSLSTGSGFWGMRTEKCRVLYVDFELPSWGLRDRLGHLAEAKKIKPSNDLEFWSLDGYAADIDTLLPDLEARLIQGRFQAAILDPVYVLMGDRDENSNSDVTDFLNRLSMLCQRTGVALPFAHHFAKGKQSEKEAKDRPSGAAAWIRGPDTAVILTQHEEEDAFIVDTVQRNMRPRSQFVVRWDFPCMRVAEGMDPSQVRTPGAPIKHTVNQVLVLLMGRKLRYNDWVRECVAKGISTSTAKRRIDDAVAAGNAIQGDDGLYQLRADESAPKGGPKS
jgi:hypothetical protein